MRRLTIFFGLIGVGTLVNAQELTRSNFPESGEEFTSYLVDTTGVSENGAGNSETWDYTGQFAILDSTKVQIKAPENTPAGNRFPEANLAEVYPGGEGQAAYNYYNVTDDSVALVGQYVVSTERGVEIEVPFKFKNPVKELVFPMEYNDSFETQYLVNDTVLLELGGGLTIEQQIYIEGQQSVVSDGVGTLQTSSKTFTDVMRLKKVGSDSSRHHSMGPRTDTTVTSTSESIVYSFFASDDKKPLLQITYGGSEVDFQATSGKEVIINEDLKEASDNRTGIEKEHYIQQMITFPNPANDQFNMVLNLNRSTPVSARIINANGQEKFYRDYGTASQGNIHKTFNTQQLDSGVYFLQVQTSGGMESRKFIVK